MQTEKKIEVPRYDGSLCTSSCGNDYDCPHDEAFDEQRGIVRSGLDFDIKHLPSDYSKQCTAPCGHSGCDPLAFTEAVADQEQRWGEERVVDSEN
jgi:hypothetical protein